MSRILISLGTWVGSFESNTYLSLKGHGVEGQRRCRTWGRVFWGTSLRPKIELKTTALQGTTRKHLVEPSAEFWHNALMKGEVALGELLKESFHHELYPKDENGKYKRIIDLGKTVPIKTDLPFQTRVKKTCAQPSTN